MKFEVTVERREKFGKGPARELRRNGKIPAVLYGGGTSLLISMDPKDARHVILSQAGHTGLITVHLTGDGKPEQRVAVMQDYQIDPVAGTLLHVDLFEVSMDKPLRVKVPVTTVGATPIGVKEGGVLQNVLRELHIECLPAQLPDHIEVDAENLQIGEAVYVKDLVVPEGVKVMDDVELMVTHVVTKMSEAKLEALLARETAEAASTDPKAADKGEATAAGDGKGESKGKEDKK
ncbi:MAG: 50S ribosomal protein L25 [Nitrospirales bacterium]|nr:50S ribosomal protein L25 [Nitrospira sp.]MDR4500444.1 50S ribosomal protein L25 [Nitrospirales bacterium]